MTVNLTKKDFHKTISKGDWIVDFWADWCGPCKIMAPQFEKAAQKLNKVNFAKVDVDDQFDLASEYEVMSIPTTIFFKNGEQVDRYTGAMTLDMIERRAKDNF